jgi:spore coat polysaccharide biosynthesis protein SpsF
MKIVAILQARLGSTRLPGKSLFDLAGKPMVQNIVERVQRATRLDAVLLACPPQDAEAFEAIAPGLVYAPDIADNDLVARYLLAAIHTCADVIVRIPCDNPCVDPGYTDQAVMAYLDTPHAYYTNTTAKVRHLWVDGVGVEVVSRSRLSWLDRITRGNDLWREHPHRWFEEHRVYTLPTADIHLDVNTEEDYLKIKALYERFGHNRFTAEEIIELAWPK